MPPSTEVRATLDELLVFDGNAELIGGRIVKLMPTGRRPGVIALEIAISLRGHARATRRGIALGDGVGFAVPELASGRESFSPDASYYDGPPSANEMRFIEGPPTFAVEVRSENDYGPAADRAIAAKRLDYFEAGTLAVWDVDPVADRIVAYRRDDPSRPRTFARGQVADAEPAVPGWTMAVDEVFGPIA